MEAVTSTVPLGLNLHASVTWPGYASPGWLVGLFGPVDHEVSHVMTQAARRKFSDFFAEPLGGSDCRLRNVSQKEHPGYLTQTELGVAQHPDGEVRWRDSANGGLSSRKGGFVSQ